MTQPKITLACAFCQSPLQVIVAQKNRAKYCGQKCRKSASKKDRRIETRLLSQIDTSGSECWPFIGLRNKDGYGQIWHVDTMRGTHRVAYELCYGPFPRELKVLHHCDNPPCCRPDHLFLGTQADNVADMVAKERTRSNLTQADADEIRRRYIPRLVTQDALAKEYRVGRSTIVHILRGHTFTRSC